MPIDTLHPQLREMKDLITMCQDFNAGSREVKLKREVYLPKLTEQSFESYNNYLYRASFFGATGRTVAAMTGAVMRKPPTIEIPDRISYISNETTTDKLSLVEVITMMLSKVLISGRPGVLVDRPAEGGNVYLAMYDAQNIVNWGKGFVVLREDDYVPMDSDPYQLYLRTRYRELVLEDGVYKQRIWEAPLKVPAVSIPANVASNPSNIFGQYEIVEEIVPTKSGQTFDYIPFSFISPTGVDPTLDKPPITDLVYENLSHFHTSADLEWGRHWVALPTPYIAADLAPDPNRKIYVGAHTMLVLPVGSKVAFAEFTGQGLGSLEKAVEQKEARMAALGARLIEPRRAQVETAETARIRQSGESSVLSGIITALEIAFTKLLGYVADWEGANPEDVAVVLNRDLIDTRIDANTITALMQGVNSGRISTETFYYNLEQGGYTIPNDTFEDEKKRIEEDIASMQIPQQASFVQPVGSSDKAQFPSMTK